MILKIFLSFNLFFFLKKKKSYNLEVTFKDLDLLLEEQWKF
jgi:hypothetical protein